MRPLATQTFIVPRLLWGLVAILLIGTALYYVLFQARFILGGPQITLAELPLTVQSKRQITLTGSAANITAIYLNGRPIVTDEYGTFNESVILQTGYNLIKIDAIDRYGRTTFEELPFVYQPAATSTGTTTLSI